MDDLMAKKVFDAMHIKNDTDSRVTKNYELLNKFFGTKYVGWQNSIWRVPVYNINIKVWMVAMDGSIRYDWKNTIEDNGDTIIEERIGFVKDKTFNPDFYKTMEYRIAVNKCEKNCTGFCIKGLYRCAENSTFYRKIWKRL